MKWTLIKGIAARWLLPALLALAVAGTGFAWWHGYSTGRAVQRAEMLSELEAARAEQAELADELETEKQKRRIVYRDRIQTVEREPDGSGCADVALPSGMLEALARD